MKTTFNMTTSPDDLGRYRSAEDFRAALAGFDGAELMYLGPDERRIIPRDAVLGLHMGYFPYWVDFRNGDTAAVLREFGSEAAMERYYGGDCFDAVTRAFRRDIATAHEYGAEYAVLHVSDAAIEETFTWNYHHTDAEVIDAACATINDFMRGEDGSLTLLLENLWQPGLTLLKPDMAARLIDGIEYPNKGIMLDTGHLMHTNTALRTEEEALGYINGVLDRLGPLTRLIRGVHLHQSLTGEYCERTRLAPPQLAEDYTERCGQMYRHAFRVDKHLPFTCPGVRELIERLEPEYLTYEFITESRAQHERYLARQRAALAGNSNT